MNDRNMRNLDEAAGLRLVRRLCRLEVAHCTAIYETCLEFQPDVTLNIGTGKGFSCLALATALSVLGKPLSSLTTVDRDHGWWEKILESQAERLAVIRTEDIKVVTTDFETLTATEHIDNNRTLLLYDIHDWGPDNQPSRTLLNSWIPQLETGLVMLHDFTPIPPGWERPKSWLGPPKSSIGVHWEGQRFYGFGECAVVIDWLSSYRASFQAIPETSFICFNIKNGCPL